MNKLTRKLLTAMYFLIGLSPLAGAAENAESVDALIDVVWTCNPVIVEDGIRNSILDAIGNWRNAGGANKYVSDVHFYNSRGAVKGEQFAPRRRSTSHALELTCSESTSEKLKLSSGELGREITEAFLNKYITVDWTESGLFKDSVYHGTLSEFLPRLMYELDSVTFKISTNAEYDARKKAIAAKEAAEEQAAADAEKKRLDEVRIIEAQRMRDEVAADAAKRAAAATAAAAAEAAKQAEAEALRIRRAQVKNGAIPVSNFDDAIYKYEPLNLYPVMKSPLLKPDRKIYAQALSIESAEGENIILAKSEVEGAIEYFVNRTRGIAQDQVNVSYAVLKLSSSTKYYPQDGLRIGQNIAVIGRYVANKRIMTTSGVVTVPVLEVTYVNTKQ